MSNARHTRLVRAVWGAAMALALTGCASTVDKLPESFGGLPASAPARPAEQPAFPNVYEVRPTRDAKALSNDEQKKLESELTTLRDGQNSRLVNPPPLPPPGKAQPPKAAAPKVLPKKEAAKKKPPETTGATPPMTLIEPAPPKR